MVTWDWAGWAGGAGIKVSGSPLDEPEMPEQLVDTKHGLGITRLLTRLPAKSLISWRYGYSLALHSSWMHSLFVHALDVI